MKNLEPCLYGLNVKLLDKPASVESVMFFSVSVSPSAAVTTTFAPDWTAAA